MKRLLVLFAVLVWSTIAQGQTIDVTTAGLKADLSGAWYDGVSNATTTFCSATYGFSSADIGKTIAITGADVGGGTFTTTISAASAPCVTLADATRLSGSGMPFYTGTDNTAALNAILSIGTRFKFPAGNYLFAAKVNVTRHGRAFVGDGQAGTKLFYTSGGPFNFFDIQSAQQTTIEDLTLWNTAPDWAGTMVTVRNSGGSGGDPAQTVLNRVSFAMTWQVNGLNVDTALETSIIDTRFSGGFTAIQGATSGSSYSNVLRMEGGQFTSYGNVAVRGGGEAWSFHNVTFEARADGRGAAFQGLSGVPITNLKFDTCWFGDATVAGRNWISVTSGRGFTAINNEMSGAGGADVAFNLGNLIGFDIRSNSIKGFDAAINWSGPVNGGSVQNNAINVMNVFERNGGNRGPWVTISQSVLDPTF